jgi:glycyl-tRNA synthetase beta chain
VNRDLLLEIGTEELPPSYIPLALGQMKGLAEKAFREKRISFKIIKVCGAPRRLVLYIEGVAEKQEDLAKEVSGPPRKVAFDSFGNPTEAARGFARTQGVKLEVLKVKEVKGKEYVYIKKKEEGKLSKEVLKEVLPQIITSLNFPKSMRWGEGDLTFARPIRWLLAILGEEVVRFSLGGLKSGNLTYGHRFLQGKSPKKVPRSSDYWSVMKKGFVIVEAGARRKIIEEGLGKAGTREGKVLEDEELLEKIVYMTEHPFVLKGKFNPRYLSLPREVLISSMREHQKCFSLVDKEEKLLPSFVAVRDGDSKHIEIVKEGNERVLNARLADAEFFFEVDKKIPLEERVEALKGMVFQENLGTLHQKALRLVNLVRFIGQELRLKKRERDYAQRAALLCKADLLTEMVGEFPSLQGIMGREYARISGEEEGVAQAIFEHYLPRSSKDSLPQTVPGAVVSIADKLDSITGCFGLGLIPSGSEDPYALRRQASGVLKIIEEKGFRVSLFSLFEKSIAEWKGGINREINNEIKGFFRERIKTLLLEKNLSGDLIEAVIAAGFEDFIDLSRRGEALEKLKKEEDFEEIAVAFKRVINILVQAEEKFASPAWDKLDKGKFQEEEEKKLYEEYLKVREKVEQFIKKEDYEKAFREVKNLRQPVDLFFDRVLVMEKDESLRRNRLAFLAELREMFFRLADFSKVVTRE